MGRVIGPSTVFVTAAVVTILGLSGCADEHDPRGAITVADSANVEIITNLPGSIESAGEWSLAADPVIEIGAGASPEVALFQVSAIVPLEGDGLAVGTNAPPQVLIFHRDGTLAATIGHEGDGPGEFASVRSLVPLSADSLAVWDSDRRRISVFTVDGHYVREVDLSAIAPPSARAAGSDRIVSGITHLLPYISGSLVLWGEGVISPPPEEPTVTRPEMPAYRIGPDGTELASFGPLPGMTTSVGGPAGSIPQPFGARTYAATTGDGFVVGIAETTELRVFAPNGALARIVRWPDHDRAVEGTFLATWSRMLDDAPEGIRDLVGTLPRAEQFPAYEGLVATKAGELLVGDYAGPLGLLPLRRADQGPETFQPELRIPPRRWLVFDSRGELVATLSTPEGFEPNAVRGNHMWGVYTDDVGVESVRAYDIGGR